MSFANPSDHDEGVNEINMTPLVDVMLVLLIIFIVTIPVVKQSLEIDLPDVAGMSTQQKSETIEISITASGEYSMNGQFISDERLRVKFNEIVENLKNLALDQPPSVEIHGDKEAKYERVAQVLSLAQQSGLYKIGFVIDGETTRDDTNHTTRDAKQDAMNQFRHNTN